MNRNNLVAGLVVALVGFGAFAQNNKSNLDRCAEGLAKIKITEEGSLPPYYLYNNVSEAKNAVVFLIKADALDAAKELCETVKITLTETDIQAAKAIVYETRRGETKGHRSDRPGESNF